MSFNNLVAMLATPEFVEYDGGLFLKSELRPRGDDTRSIVFLENEANHFHFDHFFSSNPAVNHAQNYQVASAIKVLWEEAVSRVPGRDTMVYLINEITHVDQSEHIVRPKQPLHYTDVIPRITMWTRSAPEAHVLEELFKTDYPAPDFAVCPEHGTLVHTWQAFEGNPCEAKVDEEPEDVTKEMLAIRSTAEHTWKSCYLPFIDDVEWCSADDMNDGLNEIQRQLVLDLVQCDIQFHGPPSPQLLVELDRESEVMIGRAPEPQDCGYWDHPIQKLGPGDTVMRFVEFFDWDGIAQRDFAFVRARIVEARSGLNIVGHDVLLPWRNCKFFRKEP